MIITIDGPTASGKSTVAQQIAYKLRIYYINTGMMYRALAYEALQQGFAVQNLKNVTKNDVTTLLHVLEYSYVIDHQVPRLLIHGKDCAPLLKTPEIDQAASIISLNNVVRLAVDSFARNLADNYDCILDGRDCGSVIFPHADFKFYITADGTIRAQRWLQEQQKKGISLSLQEALQTITERDERDMNRTFAPLKIPEGALVIDNSELTIEQTVNKVLQIIQQ